MPHLHGGEIPPELDGSPDSWFTSDGLKFGHKYYAEDGLAPAEGGTPKDWAVYSYPNLQEAAPIWFHDHTLGTTRLNVFAGIAGAYFIQDPKLILPSNLQPFIEVVPLVIQDRSFDSNGQLMLRVEPKRYRFLFLNGSNAPCIDPYLQGPVTAPLPQEWGWKDTVVAYPGQVTRLVVRWAPTDKPVSTSANELFFPFDPNGGDQYNYVWHRHIIEHEDNEMMRPDSVQLNPVAPGPGDRQLQKGRDY